MSEGLVRGKVQIWDGRGLMAAVSTWALTQAALGGNRVALLYQLHDFASHLFKPQFPLL